MENKIYLNILKLDFKTFIQLFQCNNVWLYPENFNKKMASPFHKTISKIGTMNHSNNFNFIKKKTKFTSLIKKSIFMKLVN